MNQSSNPSFADFPGENDLNSDGGGPDRYPLLTAMFPNILPPIAIDSGLAFGTPGIGPFWPEWPCRVHNCHVAGFTC